MRGVFLGFSVSVDFVTSLPRRKGISAGRGLAAVIIVMISLIEWLADRMVRRKHYQARPMQQKRLHTGGRHAALMAENRGAGGAAGWARSGGTSHAAPIPAKFIPESIVSRPSLRVVVQQQTCHSTDLKT